MPTPLLANLFYRCLANDLLYNGMDFCLSGVLQSNALMCANQSHFATKDKFAALEGADAIAYDPIGDENLRLAYKVEENDAVTYRIYSFTKDGKGKLLVAPLPTEKG